MIKLTSIHPFPARMAPEIVFEELNGLKKSQVVLDPMSGSGTVLRAAAELGHKAIGFDLDPLAVLMSRVWTSHLKIANLPKAAEAVVTTARNLRDEYLPWIDDCDETKDYIEFWYCKKQIKALRKLSFVISHSSSVFADAFKIILSRIIITKERGASIARDTSHSRPHRVFFDNDYDVYEGFLQSANRFVTRLSPDKLAGSAIVRRGDARRLARVPEKSVDVVITSPPYLNAIDYLRGHRLSLVWLGYKVTDLRPLRSDSIGAERANSGDSNVLRCILKDAGAVDDLPPRERGMVHRYALDVYSLFKELNRVIKEEGRVLLVVGNSCLKSIPISNADINVAAAQLMGFNLTKRSQRALPTSQRYLPTPSSGGSLSRRMKTETLLSFSA